MIECEMAMLKPLLVHTLKGNDAVNHNCAAVLRYVCGRVRIDYDPAAIAAIFAFAPAAIAAILAFAAALRLHQRSR